MICTRSAAGEVLALEPQSAARRAFLAAAVYSRHTAQGAIPEADALARVLSPERLARARVFGLAMRLGCDLSGRSPELLAASTLEVTDAEVVLSAKRGQADLLLGEQTARRLSALGTALERETRMQAV